MSASSLPVLTRRRLLLGALLLPFARSFDVLRGFGAGSNNVAGWLRGVFPDGRAAAAIGALYLQIQPEEESAQWLAHTLFGSELSREMDGDGGERLTQRVRAGRARDFCNDDLVILQGWSVTRTEARLLALLSLCSAR